MILSTYPRLGAAISALALLTACAGTSGSSTPEGDLAQMLVDNAQAIADLENEQGNTRTTMPTSGSATYTGTVTAWVADNDTATNARVFAGEAEMTARFTNAGGSVTGRFDNFLAKDDVNKFALGNAIGAGDEAGVRDLLDGFSQADGSLTLSNGAIAAAEFTADLSGTLTHDGDRIAFGGTGEGQFVGRNAEGAKFYGSTTATGGGNQITITENGAGRVGEVYANTTR
ncbi:hypothetical protein [uncultured Maritimibacter sp.]|jgi:hypothetical protein|uniref:hypothetical protein n=1 Tax=uncultured Maritimibacter sp. TaxID=991866 RepID=UPI002630EF6E|nr:hypothetical protein [uncultured Maritimibacter sp.]